MSNGVHMKNYKQLAKCWSQSDNIIITTNVALIQKITEKVQSACSNNVKQIRTHGFWYFGNNSPGLFQWSMFTNCIANKWML